MSDITHSRTHCLLFHRWKVAEIKEQKALVDSLPMENASSFEISPAMARMMNDRPAIVTYRCVDCGTEKVVKL